MNDDSRWILFWPGAICVFVWLQITLAFRAFPRTRICPRNPNGDPSYHPCAGSWERWNTALLGLVWVSLWLELVLVGYLRSLRKHKLEQKFLEEGLPIEAKVVDRFRCTVETREQYCMVVEFRNAGGAMVRREYASTAAATNASDSITLYHLAEHPQSAYYDYGLPPRGPPSAVCYGFFGGMLLAAIFYHFVYYAYADMEMGIAWQGAMLIIVMPLLVLLARSEARRLAKPYADNLLRNIPEHERVPGTHRDTSRDLGMAEAYPDHYYELRPRGRHEGWG